MNYNVGSLSIRSQNMALSYCRSLFLLFIWTIFILEFVASCPNGCACVQDGHVICNLGGLEQVPLDLPSEAQYISLNHNLIRRLQTDSFKNLAKLKFIYLDKNNITEIAPYAFRGLSNMEEIAIEKNPLDHLGSYSFSSLKNIKKIYLGYNKIDSIRANAFFDSSEITEVSLIGNPLTIIHSNAFSGFNNVHFFYFPKSISVIEKDAFNTLKNVRMLRFDNLTTNHLEQHTFRGMSNVASLELRGSHFGAIHKAAFDGLSSVDYLGVEHCSIEKIQKDAFKGLLNVSRFVFNSNSIESIENHAFWGLDSENQVKRLNFSNNHIPCDCQLHYLIDNLEKSAPDFQDYNYCNFPKELIGHLVSNVEIEILDKCESDPFDPRQIQPSMQHHHPEQNVDDNNLEESKVKNIVHSYNTHNSASINSNLYFKYFFTFLILKFLF